MAKAFDPQEIVRRYFELIRELRNGQEDAVGKLLELWNDDGVFEFAGAEPVTGIYKGKNAIHVLYKNRVAACGMPLKLAGTGAAVARNDVARDVALGVVDTQIHRIRTIATRPTGSKGVANARNERVAAGWTTLVGTDGRHGFQVAGNHVFLFRNGKISSLKVTVSPRAEATPGLALDGLAVVDIGRLSLAAWAVV